MSIISHAAVPYSVSHRSEDNEYTAILETVALQIRTRPPDTHHFS